MILIAVIIIKYVQQNKVYYIILHRQKNFLDLLYSKFLKILFISYYYRLDNIKQVHTYIDNQKEE